MKSFSHYIVTRFNIKSTGWLNDKNGKVVNDLAWLRKRYDLFERFCLPSMQSQTQKGYSWLVFFDKNTPKAFKKRNDEIKKELPQFIPFYVDDFLDFEETLRAFIVKDSKTDYILTSRFDNDDCFHDDAVKKIQEAFVPKNDFIIELTRGLTMQIEGEIKLAKRENVHSGPFVTLIEDVTKNTVKTIYNCEHTKWEHLAEFIKIDDGFFWLQTIHDSNITNTLCQDLTYNKNLLKGFNFNQKIDFKLSYILFIVCKDLGIFKFKNLFKSL
ncbi:glycosyltransferase [Winogradskyella sp.]|uniref:glycosyltransferase n=1 Tax=Winogradskyella sp. TaxID=1883156 RepID=UPI0035C84603